MPRSVFWSLITSSMWMVSRSPFGLWTRHCPASGSSTRVLGAFIQFSGL